MAQTDDTIARRAILKLCEAVRMAMTDREQALGLIEDAEALAKRIDAPRGKRAAEPEPSE